MTDHAAVGLANQAPYVSAEAFTCQFPSELPAGTTLTAVHHQYGHPTLTQLLSWKLQVGFPDFFLFPYVGECDKIPWNRPFPCP